jgi:hypothetical protein
MATYAGDCELAESYLAPLRRPQQLHITEFSALAAANVRLLLVRGKVDAAGSWLNMWRQVDPDHPELPAFESRCRSANALKTLRSLLLGRR